jgi:hypothetical protein
MVVMRFALIWQRRLRVMHAQSTRSVHQRMLCAAQIAPQSLAT